MSDSVRSSTPEGSFNLLQESLEVRTSYLSPNRAALTPEFKIRPSIISPSPFRMPSSTTSATASINAQGIAIEDSSLNNETSPESLTPESRSISSSVAAYDREAFDTELIDPAMVDRFGFLIKDLEQLDLDLSTATSTSSSNKQSKEKKEKYQTFKENARSMKWVRMLKRLEKYPITAWAKKSDKVILFLCTSKLLILYCVVCT